MLFASSADAGRAVSLTGTATDRRFLKVHGLIELDLILSRNWQSRIFLCSFRHCWSRPCLAAVCNQWRNRGANRLGGRGAFREVWAVKFRRFGLPKGLLMGYMGTVSL